MDGLQASVSSLNCFSWVNKSKFLTDGYKFTPTASATAAATMQPWLHQVAFMASLLWTHIFINDTKEEIWDGVSPQLPLTFSHLRCHKLQLLVNHEGRTRFCEVTHNTYTIIICLCSSQDPADWLNIEFLNSAGNGQQGRTNLFSKKYWCVLK